MSATAARLRATEESDSASAAPPPRERQEAMHDAVLQEELARLGRWEPAWVNAALDELARARFACRLCLLASATLLLLQLLAR